MSNIIPPLLSDSPPPIITPEDEEDEFGDFNSAVDVSYGYENLSLPSTPQHEPLESVRKIEKIDINSNTDNIKDVKYKNHINGLFSMHIDKDFQDKRKSCDITTALTETDVNLPNNQCEIKTVYNVAVYENSVVSCNGDNQEDEVKNSEDPEDGVLPKESVPIDTIIKNQLLETKNEEKSIGMSNIKSQDIGFSVPEFSANVPCSINEDLLDTLKTDNKEINVLHTEFSLNNKNEDEILCNSSSESFKIVPNDICANEYEVSEKEPTEITKEKFYFIEEPPDLHVVDDSKVQVEDFCYYDAYEDEQDLEKNDTEVFNGTDETCHEYNVTGKIENAIENLQSPSETLEENEGIVHNALENENINQEIYSNHDSNDESIEKDGPEKENLCEAKNEIVSDIKEESKTLANCYIKNNSLHQFNEFTDNITLPSNAEKLAIDSKINENVQIIENSEDKSIISKDSNHFEDNKDTVDSFCEFHEFTIPSQSEIVADNTVVDDISGNISNEFNEFVDFAQFDAKFENDSATQIDKLESNFSEISYPPNQTTVKPVLLDEDDDGDDEFGDFGDYTQTEFNVPANAEEATTSIPKMNREDILKNVERIVLEMYPPCEVCCDQFVSVDVLGTDSVFTSVKDVTETNALKYQWTKSTSHDKLLNSLNIDTRNILYGPAWNPMMPRYAANLGSVPLEPIKSSDIAASSSSQIDRTSVQPSPPAPAQVDIPNAQFDWSGSGLINPLDCTQGNTMLLDLEHLVASLDLTHSTISNTQPPSPSDEFDEWEYWLKSQPKDNSQRSNDQDLSLDQFEKSTDNLTPVLRARFHSDNDSVKSLQLTTDTMQDAEESTPSKPEINTATLEDENFDHFTSYQSRKPADYTPPWSNSTVPLRETHIANSHTTFGVLKQENSEKSESANADLKIEEGDDEFTDFQMSLPVPSASQKASSETEVIQAGFSVMNKSSGSILQPVLEPLKPMVVTHVNREVTKEPAQINWPNPGITDEDILNIELSYSRKTSVSVGAEKTSDASQFAGGTSEISKQQNIQYDSRSSFAQANKKSNLTSNSGSDNQKRDNSQISNDKSKSSIVWNNASNHVTKSKDDDEDWSDFICNQEPMKPPTQQKNVLAPEIRLSVPHLSQLQQPKKPIPVITPQGLIQTRIPSNINNLSNITVQQPSSLLQNQFRDTFRPSIISHQYQSHMNGSPFSKPNVNGCYNGLVPQQLKVNQPFPVSNAGKADDDDDWTEFISSPPVQQPQRRSGANNFAQMSSAAPRTSNIVNNTSAMPNIITNPVHSLHKGGRNAFVPYSRSAPRKSPNVNSGSATTTTSIPSISALPDLDFVGAKGRTFSKK